MKVSLILLLCISFVTFVYGIEFLTLRNTSGSIIEAQILNYQSGKVQLKRRTELLSWFRFRFLMRQ